MSEAVKFTYAAPGAPSPAGFEDAMRLLGLGGRVHIHDASGALIGALVPADDLAALEAEEAEDLADAERALAEVEAQGSIPWDRVKANLGL